MSDVTSDVDRSRTKQENPCSSPVAPLSHIAIQTLRSPPSLQTEEPDVGRDDRNACMLHVMNAIMTISKKRPKLPIGRNKKQNP